LGPQQRPKRCNGVRVRPKLRLSRATWSRPLPDRERLARLWPRCSRQGRCLLRSRKRRGKWLKLKLQPEKRRERLPTHNCGCHAINTFSDEDVRNAQVMMGAGRRVGRARERGNNGTRKRGNEGRLGRLFEANLSSREMQCASVLSPSGLARCDEGAERT
jgi:hypothetical protein